MVKITIIGAGSIVFTQQFLNDLLQVDVLQGVKLCLMSPTISKLEKIEAWTEKVCNKNDFRADIEITTDRKIALKDADYVINTMKIGGNIAVLDKEIPQQYGVNQAIGDSIGPGGVFRAARTVPIVLDLAHDMEEICPNALLLNYTNPMAMVCVAIGQNSTINFSGMCHGIQTTLGSIAAFTQTPKKKIDYSCAGINHMAWFLDITHKGEDLYPLLRENIEKPEYYLSDKVRCETMRHFGYMMTESSEHLSEYLPWFRKRKDLLDEFFSTASFGRTAGKVTSPKGKRLLMNPFDLLEGEDGSLHPRSDEFCSHIIEAMESGKSFRFNGNIINKGYIDNLPNGACVEVPILVEHGELVPQKVGNLPNQLAALNMTNINMQMLGAEAAVHGDPEMLFAAIAMDPLTQAVCSLEETRNMVCDMFEAQKHLLPQFEGKSLKRHEKIVIPPDTKPVETPIDPALAISHRIAKLFS
jgi:alpha-galactosidase